MDKCTSPDTGLVKTKFAEKAKEIVVKDSELTTVGVGIPQIDSYEKVTGKLEFGCDVTRANMLVGKILRSDRPHARIVKIDTSKAEALPGVVAVVTAEDTNGKPYGPMIKDWYILAKDMVRFIGEEVAAVAAEDELTALKALSLIDVEYEDLPAVFDPVEAMKEGAPQINPDIREGNIASHAHIEEGDVEAAFAEADYIFEDRFYSPRIYQGYLETNNCVAEVDGKGNITLWSAAHGITTQKMIYADALEIPSSKLKLIKPAIGGSFGAKFENNTHVISIVLAMKAGRPVRIEHTREEDIMASNARPPMDMTVKLGFKKDGTMLAKKVRVISNNGGRTHYCPVITSVACFRIDSLYRLDNVYADGYSVYTNTAPTGPMRGFGNAQMHFAMESLMDVAAEAMNMEPTELRRKNMVHTGDVSCHGWKIDSCGLDECIDIVEEASNISERRHLPERNSGTLKRGLGFAIANHATGNRGFFGPFDGSSALVRIKEDGTATLIHGEADLGQGQHTVFAQMLSETLGFEMDKITVMDPDTDVIPFGLGSWASRGTLMGGNAVIAAAKDARKILLETASPMLGLPSEELTIESGNVVSMTDAAKSADIKEVIKAYVYKNIGLPLIGRGNYIPNTETPDERTYGNISPAYPFAAHACEVEVDTETGKIRIVHYWAADDVGKVINPLTLEGQMIGGVAQGMGWAFTEKMIEIDGRFVNDNFLDYKMFGPCDMPDDVDVYFVESNDPNGPFGAKGASEIILNPIPATIANAVYNAIGVRIRELPITPDRILRALGKLPEKS